MIVALCKGFSENKLEFCSGSCTGSELTTSPCCGENQERGSCRVTITQEGSVTLPIVQL